MLTEKEFYNTLSTFIKNRRKDLKLTNESLFMTSNVDLSKISLLQNNKSGCNAYTLYKILFSLDFDLFKPVDNKNAILKNNINKLENVIASLKSINY